MSDASIKQELWRVMAKGNFSNGIFTPSGDKQLMDLVHAGDIVRIIDSEKNDIKPGYCGEAYLCKQDQSVM